VELNNPAKDIDYESKSMRLRFSAVQSTAPSYEKHSSRRSYLELSL